jgi:hypothetical protein
MVDSCFQCYGSGFIESGFGSVSSISSESGSGYGYVFRVLMTKKVRKKYSTA